MAEFYTILTAIGKAKIANCTVLGTKINFAKLKVGDGNGAYYEPTESQTELKHVVWEGVVNNIITGGDENPNWIITQTIIPPAVGGFVIREAGIFDEENNLLAISKYPESYKPKMEDGSTSDLTIELIFEVSNASSVTLKIDPLVTTASKNDLQNLEKKIQNQINNVSNDFNGHIVDSRYETAGGTATALTVSIQELAFANGYAKTFIARANNGGALTTINGKKLYKPGTTTSPNLMAGKAYTVWYNAPGDCFFIKASAEGSSLAKDVRKGTTFSNDNDTGIQGGLDLSLLVSGNLRAGITIDGVTGKTSVVDTADALATAAQILSGVTAYVNGAKIIGNIPVNPGLIGGTNHIQAVGYSTGAYSPDGLPRIYLRPGIAGARQCIDGDIWITAADANYIAANIVSGKSIFGLQGSASVYTLGGRKYAEGQTPTSNSTFSVALPFQPREITVRDMTGGAMYMYSALTGVNSVAGDYSYKRGCFTSVNAAGFSFSIADEAGPYYFWCWE